MKKTFLFFLLYLLSFVSFAANVSISKAETIAKKAYYHRVNKYLKPLPFNQVSIEERFTIQRDGISVYYIFNMAGMGFIAISAEDKMTPVLAYDFKSTYNPATISENFESWMNERIDNILFLKSTSSKADEDIRSKWFFLENLNPTQSIVKSNKGIEPLLWSVWDQGYPFNYDCPVDAGPGGRVWAGCVATAYGQIMYYWRWPYTGTSNHCYTPSGYDEQCADFENSSYEWDGMLDSQSYKDASAEIAKLLYHAGIGVDMMYSPDGSGAYSDDVVTAMKNYFRYSDETELIYRDGYTSEDWKSIVKDQLDNKYPMYYAGCQGKGCHAFVLDGYNDDDEYHFNLGWNGAANGWYSIDNPGGFPVWQQVIINSYPNDEYPIYPSGIKELSFLKGVITDGSGPILDYQNNTNAAWKIDYTNSLQQVETITLDFLEMKIADGDFIYIYDGIDETAPLLGSFNETNFPSELTSSGNALFIKMESDASTTNDGFRIRYKANEIESPGILTLTDYEGVIEDGSGEEYNYQDAQTSLWKIELEGVEKIYFNFDYLKTQEIYDIVRFVNPVTGEYVATFSGEYEENNLPPTITIDASSAYVLFRSDVLHTNEGFKLHYNSQLVGEEDISGKISKLEVFPNPANSELSIQFEQNQKSDIKIEIFDNQSKVIYQSEIKNFFGNYLNHIDVESFTKGIYYIQISNGENIYHHKFIKQ